MAISLEGDFDASYVEGDNSLVVATDTMKNTTYALAGEHLTGSIEAFGAALGRHFLRDPQVERATVSIDEFAWRPIGDAPDAFVRDRSSTRTAVVAATRDGVDVDAGIADLVVMKTSRSAFSGFPRDEFTTLAETEDRLLATKVSATWRYVRCGRRRLRRVVRRGRPGRCSTSLPSTTACRSRHRSGSSAGRSSSGMPRSPRSR